MSGVPKFLLMSIHSLFLVLETVPHCSLQSANSQHSRCAKIPEISTDCAVSLLLPSCSTRDGLLSINITYFNPVFIIVDATHTTLSLMVPNQHFSIDISFSIRIYRTILESKMLLYHLIHH